MSKENDKQLKRYALFTYASYYPAGGWGDFAGSFDTAEEAHKAGEKRRADNMEVIDLTTGEEV